MHVFGTDATELVHIGQAVMTCGGTVDHLVDTVFNYPTLSEAYKVAALDAVEQDARRRAQLRLSAARRSCRLDPASVIAHGRHGWSAACIGRVTTT